MPSCLFERSVMWGIFSRGRRRIAFRRIVEVLRASLFPFDHAYTRWIVGNTTGTNRQTRYDLHVGVHFGVTAVYVTEFTVKFLQHGNVGLLADQESPQLRPVNFAGGIYRGATNEIVQRN